MQAESVVEYDDRYPFRGFGNGEAYCVGQVPWDGQTGLVVPASSAVRPGAPAGRIRLFAKKVVLHCCHAPGPLNIHLGRHCMGMASRLLGRRLFVGQFGEWSYPEHGGARLRLLVEVPPELTWERAAMLEGPSSLTRGDTPYDPENRFTLERYGCYWYGETEVRPPWHKLECTPDAERTAAGMDFSEEPSDGRRQLWLETTRVEGALERCWAGLRHWTWQRRRSRGKAGAEDFEDALDELAQALRGLGWSLPRGRWAVQDLNLEEEFSRVATAVREALPELLGRLP